MANVLPLGQPLLNTSMEILSNIPISKHQDAHFRGVASSTQDERIDAQLLARMWGSIDLYLTVSTLPYRSSSMRPDDYLMEPSYFQLVFI
jgi:hypothetical protein